MKKLIAMIAAGVMGFAYGDGLKNTIGFEDTNYSTGDALETNKDDSRGETSAKFWFAGANAEELGTFAEYGEATPYNYGDQPKLDDGAPGLRYLSLDSGSTVLYRTISANTGSLPTATDIGDGLFFDSLVKFTVTEYDPTVAATNSIDEGTKLAVWLGQAESDDGDAPTNLIVTAAIWDPAAGDAGEYVATNFIAKTADGVDVMDGAWHRVTARAIQTVADSAAGFTLFIDGLPVSYAETPESLLDPSVDATAEAALLISKGELFLNIRSGFTDRASLQGFGFKGTGSIDDVSITDKANAPLFAKGQKQLTVSWDENIDSITIAGQALDLAGTMPAVVMLDAMEVAAAVTYKTGYIAGVNTGTATFDGETITLSSEVDSIGFVSAAIAYMIGDKPYATIEDALADVSGATTIKVAAPGAGWTKMVSIEDADADITLDLAGNTLTFEDFEDDYLFAVTAGKLTVIDSVGGGKIVAEAQAFYADGDGAIFLGLADDEADKGITIDAPAGELNNGVCVKGKFLGTDDLNTQAAIEDLLPEGDDYQVVADGDYWKVCAADIPPTPTQKFGGGSGTVEDPYIIATTNHLIELQADVDSGVTYAGTNFLQTADIDMEGLIWTGIGKKSSDSGMGNGSFKGIYDGGNHAITNLLLSSAKVAYVGLFSSINGNCGTAPDYGYTGAAVKNLTICLDPNTSVDNGGAVAGFVAGALIANVTVKGAITGAKVNDSNLGCFFGRIYCNTLVSNCVNWATANNSNKRTGGFSGHASNSGNLINGGTGPNNGEGIQFVDCVNNGTINAPGEKAAGFVGGHDGGDYNCIFIRCTNNGTIGQGDNGYQFINCGANGRWAYTGNKCKPDQLTCNSTIDGLNFGVVNDDVVTLITNAEVVVGGEYKVMSKIATVGVTLDTVGQTIAFDNALYPTFAATITADGVAVTTNEAGTVTTYTAKALPSPTPTWPEDWPADADDNVKKAFDTWAKAYGVTSFEGNEDAFLMNVDPEGTVPELKIESISVEGTTATIVVSSTKSLEDINGVLYVDATDDLADWTTTEVELPAEFDKDGKATFTVNAANFMKAGVGFKAPAVE